MPLVRIDMSNKNDNALGNQIGDLVYRAMMEEINVPKNDKFQVISYRGENEIIFPESYLGIEYTSNIVFIQITLNEGRSKDLKQRLYHRIAKDCEAELSLRRQDIFISLIEVSKENWSFGNGEMQYA